MIETNQKLQEMVATKLKQLADIAGIFEMKLNATTGGIFTQKIAVSNLPTDRDEAFQAAPAA